jgi:hypothetical protein
MCQDCCYPPVGICNTAFPIKQLPREIIIIPVVVLPAMPFQISSVSFAASASFRSYFPDLIAMEKGRNTTPYRSSKEDVSSSP